MKSFVFSGCFFVLILSGIILYQMNLTAKSDDIITLTQEIEKNIFAEDKEKTKDGINKLSESFSEMQNWIMAFEDHEEILTMSRCVESMKIYSDFFNKEELLNQLYNFRFLLNYSVKSVVPTIENVL